MDEYLKTEGKTHFWEFLDMCGQSLRHSSLVLHKRILSGPSKPSDFVTLSFLDCITLASTVQTLTYGSSYKSLS